MYCIAFELCVCAQCVQCTLDISFHLICRVDKLTAKTPIVHHNYKRNELGITLHVQKTVWVSKKINCCRLYLNPLYLGIRKFYHHHSNITTLLWLILSAQKARLRSTASLHASLWVRVIPSTILMLHFESNEVLLRWNLNVFPTGVAYLQRSPQKRSVLDQLGHHALKYGPSVVRHNSELRAASSLTANELI